MLKKLLQHNVEVHLVLERFISGFQQKEEKLQGDKYLRLLSNWENKADPIHLFVFLKKYERKDSIINNDGEPTRKSEGRVSSLQVFSCSHEADSNIAHMLLNSEEMLCSY